MGRASGRHCGAANQPRRATRRRGGRGPYRWTDEKLEAELSAFTVGYAEWPTLLDFDVAGRADLRSAVVDLGGAAYWAERIGLPLPPERRSEPYPAESAVQEALAIIDRLGRLPGERTLRAMKHTQLATLVRYAGGADRFVALHGIGPTKDSDEPRG